MSGRMAMIVTCSIFVPFFQEWGYFRWNYAEEFSNIRRNDIESRVWKETPVRRKGEDEGLEKKSKNKLEMEKYKKEIIYCLEIFQIWHQISKEINFSIASDVMELFNAYISTFQMTNIASIKPTCSLPKHRIIRPTHRVWIKLLTRHFVTTLTDLSTSSYEIKLLHFVNQKQYSQEYVARVKTTASLKLYTMALPPAGAWLTAVT